MFGGEKYSRSVRTIYKILALYEREVLVQQKKCDLNRGVSWARKWVIYKMQYFVRYIARSNVLYEGQFQKK
jgi:hypothetical protein